MTLARLTIASIDRMATSGALTIGMDVIDPNHPVLFTVKVPPVSSSRRSLPALARDEMSRMRPLTPLMLS